jgi:hypothetical protein
VKLPPPFYAKTALRSLNFKVKIPVIVLVLLRVLIHWGFIFVASTYGNQKKEKNNNKKVYPLFNSSLATLLMNNFKQPSRT